MLALSILENASVVLENASVVETYNYNQGVC